MLNSDIWMEYTKILSLGSNEYSSIYKAKHKKTKKYVAIKEICKMKIKINFEDLENEIKKNNFSENIIRIKEMKNSKNFIYIIMDLCSYNLKNYLLEREKPLTINEIREILIQINNFFQNLNNKKIIHGNIKPSNILINLKENNKIEIKLSYFDSIKFINKKDNSTGLLEKISLTTPPEILKGELFNNKSDIWSLGILIYYMLYKKYPFNGENDYNLLNNIISNQNIELNSENEELNNLFKRMLKIDFNERISFEEYFNHPFFKQNKDQFPQFNFNCKIHSFEKINYYCVNCEMNICDSCIEKHIYHKIIPFSQIGINDLEFTTFTNLLNDIKGRINTLNILIEIIESLMNEFKKNKNNYDVYKNDSKNNFKEYYINCLNIINDKCKIEENIYILNLNNNYITCEYEISKKELNIPIQILNCLDSNLKKIIEQSYKQNFDDLLLNDNEINKNNCVLYLNDKRINFELKHSFTKEGKNKLKIVYKSSLKNIHYMFYNCNSLSSINLYNFNTNNLLNIQRLFSFCNKLTFLDLSTFNTTNIINMRSLFSKCSSLRNINLSNFNTNNVIIMSNMFNRCSSLINLDLSNFNTSNVEKMDGIFNECCSLISLDLSNFITNKVIDMNKMFKLCFSLTSLNLSKFDTINVTNMESMFYKCSSLTSLNLSNFNTNNVENMEKMFSQCSSLTSLDLSNFNTEKVTEMNEMFAECSSLKSLVLSNFNTCKVKKMSYMFFECNSLVSLNLSKFDTSNVIEMNNMFENCFSLISLDISNFSINNCINNDEIFNNINKNCNIICKDISLLNLRKD